MRNIKHEVRLLLLYTEICLFYSCTNDILILQKPVKSLAFSLAVQYQRCSSTAILHNTPGWPHLLIFIRCISFTIWSLTSLLVFHNWTSQFCGQWSVVWYIRVLINRITTVNYTSSSFKSSSDIGHWLILVQQTRWTLTDNPLRLAVLLEESSSWGASIELWLPSYLELICNNVEINGVVDNWRMLINYYFLQLASVKQ